MSTPGSEFREAEYLGLGFLALTSSELLDQLLVGQHIDDDEKYMLQRAAKFLKDVSSGARLVTSGGVTSNVSAVETVRKLAYSVEPLKLMQDEIQSAEVGDAFDKMADSIEEALSGVIEGAVRNDLIVAKDFFHQLHVFLVSMIDADQRRTGIDTDFGVPMLAHG